MEHEHSVIVEADELTPCVSHLAIQDKKSGDIIVCFDTKNLSDFWLRVYSSMPVFVNLLLVLADLKCLRMWTLVLNFGRCLS